MSGEGSIAQEPRPSGPAAAAGSSDSADFGLREENVRRRHIVVKAAVVGLLAGLLASAFRWCVETADHWRIERFAEWRQSLAGCAMGIGFSTGLALFSVWLVVRFCPEASGSGIPHLKAVLLRLREMEWRRLLPVKFFGGLGAIASGFALGREGPTIQMGGACGMLTAWLFRVRPGEGERRSLLAAGAAAGLAAAFNAPMAGVVFVLEELQRNFTPVVFVAGFLAAVIGDVVSRFFLGSMPVMHLGVAAVLPLTAVPVAAAIGCVAGFAGVAFNRAIVQVNRWQDRHSLAAKLRFAVVMGAVVGAVGLWRPEWAGAGGHLAAGALQGEFGLSTALSLFALRFVMTLGCYGTKAAGGIFAPLLVLGSMLGLCGGLLATDLFGLAAGNAVVYVPVGMAALFAASVRAPLTGIILIAEMTGAYALYLHFLVASLAAYGIAEWLRDRPIYEALMASPEGRLESA